MMGKAHWRTFKELDNKTGTITDETLRNSPLTQRFAINEQHGLGAEKIRPADYIEITELRKTLELRETSVRDSLNVALSIARTHSTTWKQLTLQLAIVGFIHAYKHIGIDHAQHAYAHIALLSPSGIPMRCRLNTQPFGSSRAPAKWARMKNALPFILLRLYDMGRNLRWRFLRNRTRRNRIILSKRKPFTCAQYQERPCPYPLPL